MDTKLPLSALSTSGALAAQGERFFVRFDGDFDAHEITAVIASPSARSLDIAKSHFFVSGHGAL